jgi:hypothetical protein
VSLRNLSGRTVKVTRKFVANQENPIATLAASQAVNATVNSQEVLIVRDGSSRCVAVFVAPAQNAEIRVTPALLTGAASNQAPEQAKGQPTPTPGTAPPGLTAGVTSSAASKTAGTEGGRRPQPPPSPVAVANEERTMVTYGPGQRLPLFLPVRAHAALTADTGAWILWLNQTNAHTTRLIPAAWPVPNRPTLVLVYWPDPRRCADAITHSFERPYWLSSVFHPRVNRGSDTAMMCADVRGHTLVAEVTDRMAAQRAELPRVSALLSAIVASL